MQSTYQAVRDGVISALIKSGKDAAGAYIASIDDSDHRDAARTHLANFLAIADDLPTAFQLANQIENQTERLDALLSIARILSSHHRLQERQLLDEIKKMSEGNSRRSGFSLLGRHRIRAAWVKKVSGHHIKASDWVEFCGWKQHRQNSTRRATRHHRSEFFLSLTCRMATAPLVGDSDY